VRRRGPRFDRSGSKVRLGTKFAIGDSNSDRDDGSNFSDEGDSDSISDDPEQRRQRGPGQQRQRRRQRGRWRVVKGTSRDVREGPHREQQRRMAAPVVRRRFDVDETGPCSDGRRGRGLAGACCGRHFWGVEVSGGAGDFRGWGGWAERETLPVAVGGRYSGRRCGKRASPFSGLELHANK